ncbi:hypothetical protein [Haloplanus pelagicus]|jgi:hypothetical protein|uniref:hypothetical protein n=1 Tax=Haloplanus pelagicus TaxID=2949995 RepID=UPI00203FC161|nr:hypothetical protein [Haloplanus sp. HW8-1]
MSESEPPADELDRDTITGNGIANWLNANGPEWVLWIEPLDGDPEYLGFVDGRFKVAKDDEIIPVALHYISDLADRARRVEHRSLAESPFTVDDEDDDGEDG